jgi:hypothetical protein
LSATGPDLQILAAAEGEGYELFITTDQKLRHQQNLIALKLAVLVLLSTSWPRIRMRIDDIRAKIAVTIPGGYDEVAI